MRELILFKHSNLNNIDKTSKEIITRCDATGTRGNCLKLYKKRFNHDVKKHSFSNRVVNLWNSLTDDIVTAPSLNSFKSRLNKLWKPMNNSMHTVTTED